MKLRRPALLIASTLFTLCNPIQSFANEDLQDQIEALQTQLQELQKQQTQTEQRVDAFRKKTIDQSINFHGYMSVGLSQMADDGAKYGSGESDDLDLLPNSWFGLQMNAQLSDSAELVVQVVARGIPGGTDNNYELNTEWLYFKQDLGAGFDLQAGRIRLPLFQESSNYYVGNTYPWISPPESIYSVLELTSVDGVSISHRAPIEDWSLDTQLLLWADSELQFGNGSSELDKVHGVIFNFSNDEMQFRLAHIKTEQTWDVDLVDVLPVDVFLDFGDELTYNVQSFKYDDGLAYVSLEAVQVSAEDNALSQSENYNLTLGWYFDTVLVYVGISEVDTKDGDEISEAINNQYLARGDDPVIIAAGDPPFFAPADFTVGDVSQSVLNKKQSTTMAGIKWDITPKMVYKFQVSELSDFDGTIGLYNDGTAATGIGYEDTILYEMAVQAMF